MRFLLVYFGIHWVAGVRCMLGRKIFILVLLIATVALTGCGSSPNRAAITGIVAHTHTMILPEGTVVTVQIIDTTKADSPGKKVAEQIIKSHGDELPLPFAVVYDPGKINPDHTYTMRVKVEDSSGQLLYTNTSDVPVITHGNLTRNIEVIVVIPNG
jgi:putative lipoprotein